MGYGDGDDDGEGVGGGDDYVDNVDDDGFVAPDNDVTIVYTVIRLLPLIFLVLSRSRLPDS